MNSSGCVQRTEVGKAETLKNTSCYGQVSERSYVRVGLANEKCLIMGKVYRVGLCTQRYS